jgi:hypothetical protein
MQDELKHRQMVQGLMSALIDVLADHPEDLRHDAILLQASAWLKSRQGHTPSPHQVVTPLTPGSDLV